MKRYEYNYGKNPEGALSTISGYATETTNFGETAFGILNKSTRDEENFTTPEVVSSSTATLFSVGNGTDHDSRKNIIELKADGTVYINGVGQYDGTNPGEATDIADEFQGIHDDITGLNEDVDRIDNTIESIHISEDDENLIYTLLVDGQERGTINIPRDQFLKNVSYNEETNNLEFTFIVRGENNEEVEKQVNVNMTDLEDIYSAGDGLNLENKQFSVKVDSDTQPYIEVSSNGVKIIGINEALDKKVSWDESKKVITLPADGSISALRNNGLEGGVLVCQRTYDEGATYVTEVGTTKNNLTLNSIERPKIDFADGTSQNVAYESEVKSLQNRMSTAETDIDNLEGRMDTAEGDIDTIQSDLSDLTGDGEGSVQDQIKMALEDYLPLSGGTLSGDLLFGTAGIIREAVDSSSHHYLNVNKSGSSSYDNPIVLFSDEGDSVRISGRGRDAEVHVGYASLYAKYGAQGITISDKTENDLLNAAGSTTSIDDIKEAIGNTGLTYGGSVDNSYGDSFKLLFYDHLTDSSYTVDNMYYNNYEGDNNLFLYSDVFVNSLSVGARTTDNPHISISGPYFDGSGTATGTMVITPDGIKFPGEDSRSSFTFYNTNGSITDLQTIGDELKRNDQFLPIPSDYPDDDNYMDSHLTLNVIANYLDGSTRYTADIPIEYYYSYQDKHIDIGRNGSVNVKLHGTVTVNDNLIVSSSTRADTIWTGTQSEYEGLTAKYANTLYFITEG